MRFRSDRDIIAFRDVLEECSGAVWLIVPGGKQINMKTLSGQYEGISRLLKDKYEQLELFTGSYEDEMKMLSFFSGRKSSTVHAGKHAVGKKKKFEVYTDSFGELQFRRIEKNI